MTSLSAEEMIRINHCATQVVGFPHGEAKYEVTWRMRGDPSRHLIFKLCEECSLLIRTHPDLISIKSIPREPVTP